MESNKVNLRRRMSLSEYKSKGIFLRINLEYDVEKELPNKKVGLVYIRLFEFIHAIRAFRTLCKRNVQLHGCSEKYEVCGPRHSFNNSEEIYYVSILYSSDRIQGVL